MDATASFSMETPDEAAKVGEREGELREPGDIWG